MPIHEVLILKPPHPAKTCSAFTGRMVPASSRNSSESSEDTAWLHRATFALNQKYLVLSFYSGLSSASLEIKRNLEQL